VREEGLTKTMSSAAGVLLRSQDSIDSDAVTNRSRQTIFDLAHDLRQPLSAIEAIAYYLEMTLPADQLDARRNLARLQELVMRSDAILTDAVRSSMTS